MKPRVVAVFAVFVLALVVGAIWFLQAPPPGAPPLVSATPMPVEYKPELVEGGELIKPETRPDVPRKVKATLAAPAVPPPPLAVWEARIVEVLESKNDETQTAQLLINLIPTFPPEGQAQAAQHVANLILDKDYGRVLPMLKNTGLSQELQETLVQDLANRDDSVKMPAWLEVARIPNHPFQAEAMSNLEIFLDEQNGTDWAKWGNSIRRYLQKQAAEAAAVDAAVQQ